MAMSSEVFFAVMAGAFVFFVFGIFAWAMWGTREKPYVNPDAKLTPEEQRAKWQREDEYRKAEQERREMEPFMDVIKDFLRERRCAQHLQEEGNTIIVPKPECLVPVAGFAEAAKVAAYLKKHIWHEGFTAKVEHRVSTEKGKPDQIYVLAQWEVQQ